MDWLDIANPKARFTASATYYEETVDDPSDGGQKFQYEYVNPFSNTYRRLFGNIQSTEGEGECTIRTDNQVKFKTSAYVILQDGRTFQIVQVEQDFAPASKQAMRILAVPASVQYVIRMVRVPNPWGVA